MHQSPRPSELDAALLVRRALDMRFVFFAVLDLQGVVVEVNHAPERRGYVREDFLGRHIGDTPSFRGGADWVRTWNARLQDAASAGEPVSYEDLFVGPGGETLSADAILTPVTGDSGRLECFVLEAEDTTDRVRVELELRASERRFHDLAESIPVLCMSTDAAGNCDYLNDRWLEYTGAGPGQHHGWNWIDAVHSDDRPALAEQWSRALRDGTPLHTEYRLRHRDGGYRWHDIRTVPVLGEDDQVTRWYGTAADVNDAHELRRSLAEREAQLGAALRAGAMARFAYDLEHRSFTADRFLREVIELPADLTPDLGLEGFVAQIHPEDRPRWQAAMQRAFDASTPDYLVEYRMNTAQGVAQWIGSRGRVSFDPGGKPQSIVGVVYALAGPPAS